MNLLIAFSDQSKSFCNGVEFGRIWSRMEQGAEIISNGPFPVRYENKDVLESACDSYGYVARFGDECNGWVGFTATKKEKMN